MIRILLALTLALGAIIVAFPLAPWSSSVRTQLGQHTVHGLVIVALALATFLVPAIRLQRDTLLRPAEAAAITVGLLLLLEPLIHLMILAIAGLSTWPSVIELVLPRGRPMDQVGDGYLVPVAMYVLLPAIVEEGFFRGRLLPWLSRRIGSAAAVSLTALAFAAAHGSVTQVLIGIPLGIMLGIVRLRSASWYPCVLAHAVHNALFFIVGGALAVAPVMHLILFIGGAWLVALGTALYRAPDLRSANRRFALRAAAGLLVMLIIWPLQQQLHEAAWLRVTGRLMFLDSVVSGQRLVALEERGHLDSRRREILIDKVLNARDEPFKHRVWLLSSLAPERMCELRDQWPNDAMDPASYATFALLYECPIVTETQSLAAFMLAGDRPRDFALFAHNNDDCLSLWLPLPKYREWLVALLTALEGTDRMVLMRIMFRDNPIDVATDTLLALPFDSITQRDRVFLRRYHPDPIALQEQLALSDPERAAAWFGPPSP